LFLYINSFGFLAKTLLYFQNVILKSHFFVDFSYKAIAPSNPQGYTILKKNYKILFPKLGRRQHRAGVCYLQRR